MLHETNPILIQVLRDAKPREKQYVMALIRAYKTN